MEPVILLILIGILILIIVLPIAAFARSGEANRQVEDLRVRLRDMDAKLRGFADRIAEIEGRAAPSSFQQAAPVEEQATVPALTPEPIKMVVPEAAPPVEERHVGPPPLPIQVAAASVVAAVVATPALVREPKPTPVAPPPVQAKVRPDLSLEQFLGQKLFAWVAGVALFFGIMFFVKHYFENHSLPPAVRVAIGFTIGTGLVMAGVVVHRRKAYTVLGQTFCASGVLILYGVAWAASNSFYHLIPPAPTFALMVLITTVAFLIAVRLDALVVAILGMVGGFLTPYLCSTGEDRPFALFGYIALLDIGLLMVARVRRWFFLASMGAIGTALMEFGWLVKFFDQGKYFLGSSTLVPMGIVCGFIAPFLIAAYRTKQDENGDLHPAGAAMGLCGIAMLFAFGFLTYPDITNRPLLLYSFVFLINTGVLAGIVIKPRTSGAQIGIGLATFAHLSIWTLQRLQPDMLGSALVVYLVFGALHSVFPVVWQRLKPGHLSAQRGAFSAWFAPLTLILMMLPMVNLPKVSFLIWPAVLLVDLLAIMLAVATFAVAPVLAALVLTLTVAFVWLFKLPVQHESTLPFLIVVGGFAAVFAVAGSWLAKRFTKASEEAGKEAQVTASLLPVASAVLPFILLIMATLRLPMADPSPVFGLALLLVILLLGLAKIARQHILCLTALASVTVLEAAWHAHRFDAGAPWTALIWYLGFYGVFALYPFLFRKSFRDHALPWAAAALAAVGQGTLTYFVVKASFPAMTDKLGLVPAMFAIPSLIGLLRIVKYSDQRDADARNTQLAWFGGVALLFITLIFPIQFDRQWITLGWAFEGAALLWLFYRVPHKGLINTGLVLLGIAFIRLALNPAVLGYHARSGAILNWHLYTYGLAAVAQFLGAKWLLPPHDRWEQINLRGVLCSFGGVLLFLLLNIEIADYFTPARSSSIVFDFSGNLARDMTYSIAWALFALALISLGFVGKAKGSRLAGIGLMVVTLLKLFLHDLASIDGVYRVGALIAVALIALAASYLYQRFADRTSES